MAVAVAQCHADAGIWYSADDVGFYVVVFAHHLAVTFAYVFYVNTFVVAGGEAVIDPEEGTDLLLRLRFLQHFNAVGAQAHDFTGSDVANGLIIKVGERGGFAGGGVGSFFLADDNRRAA